MDVPGSWTSLTSNFNSSLEQVSIAPGNDSVAWVLPTPTSATGNVALLTTDAGTSFQTVNRSSYKYYCLSLSAGQRR